MIWEDCLVCAENYKFACLRAPALCFRSYNNYCSSFVWISFISLSTLTTRFHARVGPAKNKLEKGEWDVSEYFACANSFLFFLLASSWWFTSDACDAVVRFFTHPKWFGWAARVSHFLGAFGVLFPLLLNRFVCMHSQCTQIVRLPSSAKQLSLLCFLGKLKIDVASSPSATCASRDNRSTYSSSPPALPFSWRWQRNRNDWRCDIEHDTDADAPFACDT